MTGVDAITRGLGRWRRRSVPALDNAVLRELPVDASAAHAGPDVRPGPVVGACFARVTPTPIAHPELVLASQSALRLVGIETRQRHATVAAPDAAVDDATAETDDEVDVAELVPFLAGNEAFPGAEFAAQCYCGHQFGSFSGQLGDGAAMYLGEHVGADGRWELQLKGAGRTPFSRTADGRKVLRSSLREFLASEHLHALGIPTTRAGSVVVSRESTVLRDMFYDGNAAHEPTAVVLRIARSFLRFGSFEIFKPTDALTGRTGPSADLADKPARMRQMLDFTIRQYYPEIHAREGLETPEDRYREFFAEVVRRTARLVAQWQSVGFCHGVLNTDNMSIVGDTLDYGPFGFMEHFDPGHVCNTSDDTGRYRFEAQPEICRWNCTVLADQLALVMDRASLEPSLGLFDQIYDREYQRLMRAKLGLVCKFYPTQDRALIASLLEALTETGADYTCTFRVLMQVRPFEEPSHATVVHQLVELSETLTQVKRRYSTFTDDQFEVVSMLLAKNPIQARMYGVTPQLVEHMTRERAKRAELERSSDAERHAHLRKVWTTWVQTYAKRLQDETEGQPDPAHDLHRIGEMRRANPIFVLRNHVAQKAIEAALDGDYDRVAHVFHLLTHPFQESEGCDLVYARPQDPETPPLCVSCSS